MATVLPYRFAPVFARRAAHVLAVLIFILTLFPMWSRPGGSEFDSIWFVAVPLTSLTIISILLVLVRPHAVASVNGVEVVNMLSRRDLAWEEIVAVRFGRNDPWVRLDISDGTSLNVLAIQASDGDRGRAEAQLMADLVETHGRAEQD
jgi:hypothetical protein